MKKIIVFVLLFLQISSLSLFAKENVFPYSEHWKKVDELAEKQLPESALKEVETIFNEAKKTQNFIETVRATIYKMRFTLEKEPDNATALLLDFEAFNMQNLKPEEKALVHSMTAELYTMYYQRNQYVINQRTQIDGYIPEDVNEWSKNIFFDKIATELKLSLNNAALLQQTNISIFENLIDKGNDSAEYQPTLFDFFGQRAISLLQNLHNIAPIKNPLNKPGYFISANDFIKIKPDQKYAGSKENLIIEIYQQLLSFRLKENNTPALLYIDLQRLNYLYEATEHFDADKAYENALLVLQKKYRNNEAVVEVQEQLARFYLNQRYSSGEENNVYKKKAFDIVQNGIAQHPDYKRVNSLKIIEAEILQKEIEINYPAFIAPQHELTVKANTTNVRKLELKLYRVTATALEYYNFKQNNNRKTVYPKRNLIETKQITIVPGEDFGKVTTEIKLLSPEYGIYEFSIEQRDDDSKMEQIQGSFTVTDFAFINRQSTKNKTSLYVLNRTSGKAVPGVDVEVVYYKWNGKKHEQKKPEKYQTGKDGFLQISNDRYSNTFFLSKGADQYFCSQADSYFYDNPAPKDRNTLALFTDRSIYRPGQTVYFKGIAYSAKKQEIVKNTDFEVKLLDANWQEVSKKQFKTNGFGSFSGEFILPESGLNGMYRLQNEFGSTYFYVEEYKRPTFETKIEKPGEEVHFGEKIVFKGNVKAYAGHNIPGAQVDYVIERHQHHLFRWNYESPRIVAGGTTESNENGNFEIDFVPEKTQNKSLFPGLHDRFYTYTFTAIVTDSKGETQVAAQSVSVGDKSLFIIAETPATHNKQNPFSLKIQTKTLNEKTIPSLITYTLYQLDEENKYREEINDLSTLKNKKQTFSGIFDTKNDSLNLDLSKLASGYYKLQLVTPDAQGKEVKKELFFILYSKKDKQPPVKTYNWMTTSNTEISHGESAEIYFGSSENISVLYEIMQGNNILESKRITINNEIKTFKIPFKKSHGDGLNVMFTFVKDEKLYTNTQQIRLKTEEKKLSPALSTFRDKLQPGETTEWVITIPETAGEKLLAELMVGMYDASLDAIRPHNWNFNPVNYPWIPYASYWNGKGFNNGYNYSNSQINITEPYQISLDRLRWFGLNFHHYSYGGRAIRVRGAVAKQSNMHESEQGILEMAVVAEDSQQTLDESVVVAGLSPNANEKETTGKQVQIRTNFNETAFFYPQLTTDTIGNIKFSFTAPESLTRWNVKMLAHTPDLYFGQAQAQAVTQKDLMVQLNMPRFVRRSDKLILKANVINLTEKTFPVKINFQLINPENEQQIILKDNKTRNITLGANQTQSVEWEITEFSYHELVVAKIIAQAEQFSDGEQHYLPVLPDKILVTESLPLTIRGNETRNFRFENLIKQGNKVDTKSLTIEFASNPVWYAVQALSTLSAPENENAIDYFTAYYTNGLATHIANSNPKIAAIFDRWKREGGSREALLSNLEKNTELKNMLLEETPWILAAKDETEQKRQIALLFDLNQQKNQGEQYLNKLISLQKPSGGFAWFDGMSENRYITQQILLGMARYNKMTAPSNSQQEEGVNSWKGLEEALHYIDLQIAKDLSELKKNNKNYKTSMVIGDMQWMYLHLRSEYKDIPVHDSAKEAVAFYTSQAEKYWTKATLYGKAATALISHRNGNSTLANDILKSLKENALKTDEMGMYWARNTAGYFWNERPVSVQTAILEAFAEITQSTADIDEMKIWLLKQKQTQRWDSPISTVDAIYALLNYGSDWLANEGQVDIKLNNKTIEPQSKEAGTGYFKTTIPVTEIIPEIGNVNIRKSDSGVAWGAMYWQYYQEVDQVRQHGKSLSVTKKLFVEKNVDNKTTMIPVEQTQIKTGDKIVTRLVVTTDRNLEFVALKDLRPACLEPVDQLSGTVWHEGISYYKTIKDASTHFYFNFLPKGTYVFEYASWANNSGKFVNGTANIQCLYAPEFVGHSSGGHITIE